MRVDQLRDVGRQGLPVVDELGLADLLAHARTDHVHADDRAVLLPDQLDEALGLQDLALAVATEVVVTGLDLGVPLAGLGLGEAHRGDLGVAVGAAGDAELVDGRRSEPGDPSATKMPWAKPRWASCSPGTMSPTANTPSTLVRHRS